MATKALYFIAQLLVGDQITSLNGKVLDEPLTVIEKRDGDIVIVEEPNGLSRALGNDDALTLVVQRDIPDHPTPTPKRLRDDVPDPFRGW